MSPSPHPNLNRALVIGGYAFLGISLLSLLAMGFILVKVGPTPSQNVGGLGVFESHLQHLLCLGIAVLSALLAVRLLSAAGANAQFSLSSQDADLLRPLITDGKATAIDQYVRLSSLSGFTGLFTKLGLTGLPLVTIAVTLIFALLGVVDREHFKEFIDLSKLTLGAFIGSFVQRHVERHQPEADKGKKDLPV